MTLSHPATAAPAPSPEPSTLRTGPQPPSPNGSPSPSKLPQARRLSGNARLIATVVAVAVLGGGGFLIYYLFKNNGPSRADILTHTVKLEDLQMAITERGQLESAVNRDVVELLKGAGQYFAYGGRMCHIVGDQVRLIHKHPERRPW